MSDLLDLPTVNATWHSGPCAEVRVGDRVTRYVRHGIGPSVLLLTADSETSPTWSSLVEWLGSSIVLFAGAELRAAALELAAADDFTVHKLVLLPGANAAIGAPSSRVLWVLPAWSPTEALSRIENFLSTEE